MCWLELEIKVREDFTFMEKAPLLALVLTVLRSKYIVLRTRKFNPVKCHQTIWNTAGKFHHTWHNPVSAYQQSQLTSQTIQINIQIKVYYKDKEIQIWQRKIHIIISIHHLQANLSLRMFKVLLSASSISVWTKLWLCKHIITAEILANGDRETDYLL